LREDHAAGRAHHHVGHLDDPDPLKRQSRSGHDASPSRLVDLTLGFREPSEKYNLSKGVFTIPERWGRWIRANSAISSPSTSSATCPAPPTRRMWPSRH